MTPRKKLIVTSAFHRSQEQLLRMTDSLWVLKDALEATGCKSKDEVSSCIENFELAFYNLQKQISNDIAGARA